jgi:type II restriction/modification system DNA methylase subunit YeeA
MFQAVISVDQRGSLGQHYTSVPNIMKVIEPLFLNDLYEEFENADGKEKKYNALLYRIQNIKIFDPACGSGNFLIIAYKELRILEMKIFKEIGGLPLSGVRLSQFYGIEIDDFAGEIAKLALWLAEHQMNVEFFKEFGRTNPTLPLKEAGKIVQGNATRLDWDVVCPKNEGDEIYILGNPPYLGFSMQTKQQKEDMTILFEGLKNYKFLDYISCWFYLGSKYLFSINGQCAFVSTNSICQGNQVDMLWPHVLNMNIEISFAYPNFKWDNNAKSKAQVICSIIGLRNKSNKIKYLFNNQLKEVVKNINPYLVNAENIIIKKRNTNLSHLPKMVYGNMPLDGGHLLLDEKDKNEIVANYPKTLKYFKPILGSREFINNLQRWCLWLDGFNIDEVLKIKPIEKRIQSVKEFRENGGIIAKNYKKIPHRFYSVNIAKESQIIIPRVSSERRLYIPMGFLKNDIIISDSAQAIYDPQPFIFGILNSKIHMIWFKSTAGRLKTDYRYSSALSYNTFPFPQISTQRKNEITQAVFRILEEREKHSDKTLAQLYNPDKMPEGLREAHRQNDEIIEKCYRSTPFNSEEERLEYLFKLYEKMIAEEKEQGTLFAKEKKTRKKRK